MSEQKTGKQKTEKQKTEKQKITKFRVYATIDREEIFLNEMCAQGWKPVKIILGAWFQFEKCQPGEYITRVTTCVDPKGRKASKDRRNQLSEILTESGAEIIPETNVDASTRIYAVQRADRGNFEINTDIDSLICEYTGRRRYHIIFSVVAAAFLACSVFLGSMMVYDYLINDGDRRTMISACMEFLSAAVLLACFIALLMPIPSYSKKLRELRGKREFEE